MDLGQLFLTRCFLKVKGVILETWGVLLMEIYGGGGFILWTHLGLGWEMFFKLWDGGDVIMDARQTPLLNFALV